MALIAHYGKGDFSKLSSISKPFMVGILRIGGYQVRSNFYNYFQAFLPNGISEILPGREKEW